MLGNAGATACPVPRGTPLQTPPDAESLAYSFTLSAGPVGPRIARETTKTVLKAHGLKDMQDAVVQVVGELAACAWRFTPTPDIYVNLRYRDGALRVIVYDGHPRHAPPPYRRVLRGPAQSGPAAAVLCGQGVPGRLGLR